MKITIDTTKKSITLDEEVKMGDLIQWMKDHLSDYKKYQIVPSLPSYHYCPRNCEHIYYSFDISKPYCLANQSSDSSTTTSLTTYGYTHNL
jgi:hypothetical protein